MWISHSLIILLCFILLYVCAHSVVSDSLWSYGLQPTRLLCPLDTGVGCHFLFQRIFPTQGSNPCLLWLLYWQVDSLPLNHQGATLPHTHRHHCSKSHLNPSINLWTFQSPHNFLFTYFFPVLSLIHYSLLTKFFIWVQLILPFSVLYPEYQLACLHRVSVFIELKFLVNPGLGQPKFHLNVMHR